MTVDHTVKEKSLPIIAKASSCDKLSYAMNLLPYEIMFIFFLLVPARKTYYRRNRTQREA